MNIEHGTAPTWAKLVAAGMLASVALTGCTTGRSNSNRASINTTIYPTESIAPQPELPTTCAAIATPTDLTIASHLMAEPGNKYVMTAPIDPKKRKIGLDTAIAKAAAKQGLTVYNERALADEWYARINSKHSPSYQQVFNVAYRYMAQLGVDLEVGAAHDPDYSYGSRRPTVKELDTLTAKNDLIDTMTAYSTVPKEFLALGGLKHIYLVAGTDKTVEGYTDAFSEADNAYYKDIKEADGPEIDLHEFSHMLDSVECKRAIDEDPNWQALNKGASIYVSSTNDTKHVSYEGKFIFDSAKRINEEYTALYINNDKTKYCSLASADETEAKKVITYSNYHTTPTEDKAEIMKNIAYDYGWTAVTNKKFPYLYDKFRLALARLNHLSPKLAQYFADVSNRDETYIDPKAPKC